MKLSIAAALSHRPELLILDEPTGGLDPIVREEILDLFSEFIQDERNSILFSTHITTDLEKIADQIVFLNFSRWRCLARVARRYLENRGKTRLSMAADCPEKLDGEFIRWVLWDGRTRRKRDQYAALAARYPDKMVILRTPAQLDAFRRQSLAQRAAARRGR